MSEENGQKFSSGKAYKENQTDFSSFLKIAKDDESDNIEEINEIKTNNVENKEDDYTNLLKQAMEDDSDFDELEDGFEEEIKKITESTTIESEKKEPIEENTKKIIDEIKEEIVEENPISENNDNENVSVQKEDNENVPDEKNDSDNITGADLLNALNVDKTQGKGVSAIEAFNDSSSLVEGKVLKRKFNPNPPVNLIEGHDFNDPYLDDIYCYSYSDEMLVLRDRKSKQRQEKIERLKEEEQRLEEEKEKKKKKKKKASNKPQKELKIPDKYPKVYEDPTDEEIDDKTGKPYYYFNFTKTLNNSKLKFLSKILPTSAIDEVLYDKGFLDGVAEYQHEKATKLNNMSASEQYSRDLKNIGITIGVFACFIFAVLFKFSFSIIPDNKYEAALTTLNNKDYENAYYEFTELGNKELSVYYAKYSEAKMYYKTEQYDKAKEAFTLLQPYNDEIFKPLHINIDDEINECSYQIALAYYYEGDFESAKNIFKEIYTYSDATEKYYECGYKIAKEIYETWQDDEDLEKSLKYFYKVRNYTESDVQSYISTISDMLYGNAENYYAQKDYKNALDIYSYLALFNYVNPDDETSAKDMVNQCTYRYGLDLYKNKQYESARKVLAEIPEYKDSYVLAKECVYNTANSLYENNPVGSIAEYEKITGYKTSDSTLYSPRLIMYGKWEITEMNKSSINPIDFSFYDDGQFMTNKQILAVAISTEATPISYSWDGEKFSAKDGAYTIIPKYDEETEKLTIICSGPSQTIEYICTRVLGYEDMIVAEKNQGGTTTGEETLNQKFKNLIQDYVTKKTDGVVKKDDADVNIFEGKTD